jgi:hypothetical protein
MNITLGDLVRDIVEVYIDVIVVKIRESNSLLENLAQVFDKLHATSTKLNPEKCVFGVSVGKLLGFLVSHRGIEANPDKIRAIETMRTPALLKDMQRLTGSLAALSRFISRLAERALPFFKLMRGFGPFTWTDEAEQAFQEMKQYLTSLPVLDPGKTLFLYLAAMTEVISMVLARGPPCRRWRSGLHQCGNRPCSGESGWVPTRGRTRRPGVRRVPSSGRRTQFR